MYCCISIFLGIRTGKSLRVMSSSLNTHIWEDEWKIWEGACASFEIAHWTRCKKLIFLIMFPMNLWIYSFHRINALQSNLQAAELLLSYSPFPGAHLWFIQLGKIPQSSCPAVKWLACISILTMPLRALVQHISPPLRGAVGLLCDPTPSLPPDTDSSFKNPFSFSEPPLCTNISLLFFTCHHFLPEPVTLIWLLNCVIIWNIHSNEPLLCIPLDPALFSFFLTPTSLNVLLRLAFSQISNRFLKLHHACVCIAHTTYIFSANSEGTRTILMGTFSKHHVISLGQLPWKLHPEVLQSRWK